MQIKAVYFDYDGLLFDTEKIYCKYWVAASQDLGYDLREEDALLLRSCDSKLAAVTIKEKLGLSVDYSAIKARRKELMEQYYRDHEIELKTGATELVSYLATQKHLRIAVVTSSRGEEKKKILEEHGLLQYFTDIVSADSVSRGKPFPDVYNYACQSLGVEPAQCVAFEDSPNGVRSAVAAGVQVVMIPDLTEPTPELSSMATVLRSLEEGKALMERFFSDETQ